MYPVEILVICWSASSDSAFMRADVGDLLGMIVFILFVVASLVSQLLQQKKPKGAVEGKPMKPGSSAGDVGDEIRKFLEQAADAQKRKRERGRKKSDADKGQDAVVIATAVPAEGSAARWESVGEHVRQHIGQEHFGKVVSQVGMADEQLESRLHEVFDHRLGKISGSAPSSQIEEGTDAADKQQAPSRSAAPQSLAKEIAQAMRNPTSLRQAILINEVLRPRDHVFSNRK